MSFNVMTSSVMVISNVYTNIMIKLSKLAFKLDQAYHLLSLASIRNDFGTNYGSPHSGILFDIRLKTRWEYHYMFKVIKLNREYTSAKRTSEGLSGIRF